MTDKKIVYIDIDHRMYDALLHLSKAVDYLSTWGLRQEIRGWFDEYLFACEQASHFGPDEQKFLHSELPLVGQSLCGMGNNIPILRFRELHAELSPLRMDGNAMRYFETMRGIRAMYLINNQMELAPGSD
jgi:hypothetical protein